MFYVFKYLVSSPIKGFEAVEPHGCEGIDPEDVFSDCVYTQALTDIVSLHQHWQPFIEDRSKGQTLAFICGYSSSRQPYKKISAALLCKGRRQW